MNAALASSSLPGDVNADRVDVLLLRVLKLSTER